MNTTETRRRNIELLKSKGFRPAEWLPLSESTPTLRPSSEILARFLAMEAVFNYACGRMTPEASLLTQLKPSLTDSELEILSLPQDDAVEKFSYNIGWKLENMWPLAWVLGWEKQPDVDGSMIDDDTIEAMLTDFMTRQPQLKLRSIDEVAALEDLFYCAHNAAVSARLGHDTAPESFHPIMNGGVIHERRHALTWCLSDCAWDDTDLNT